MINNKTDQCPGLDTQFILNDLAKNKVNVAKKNKTFPFHWQEQYINQNPSLTKKTLEKRLLITESIYSWRGKAFNTGPLRKDAQTYVKTSRHVTS